MDAMDEEGKAKEQANNEAQAEAEYEARRAEAIEDAQQEADAPTPMETEDGRILGVNKRSYPTEDRFCCSPKLHEHIAGQCADPPPVLAVLVQGRIGDYACYVGIGSDWWVKQHGDKISFKEAQCHFPTIMRSKYRD